MVQETWWNETRKQLLKDLWDKNSCSQIAAIVGAKSRSAVVGCAHRMGLSKPKPPPAAKKRKKRHLTEAEKAIRRMPKPICEIIKGDDIPPLLDSIHGLSSDNCAYPYGARDFKFCGRPRFMGSFCHHHAAICYRKPEPRRIGDGRFR
jgi:hypothetical protein